MKLLFILVLLFFSFFSKFVNAKCKRGLSKMKRQGFMLNVGRIQKAHFGMKPKKMDDGKVKPHYSLGAFNGEWWNLETDEEHLKKAHNITPLKPTAPPVPELKKVELSQAFNDYDLMFAVKSKIGTPAQDMTFLLSSSRDEVLVRGSYCTGAGCEGRCVNKYSPETSESARCPFAEKGFECCDCLDHETMGDFDFEGFPATDRFVVDGLNSKLAVDSQNIMIGNQLDLEGVDGVIGLNPSEGSFLCNLQRRNAISSNISVIGVWINPEVFELNVPVQEHADFSEENKDPLQALCAGEITIGDRPDKTRFFPPLEKLDENECLFTNAVNAMEPNSGEDLFCELEEDCTVEFDFSSTSFIYMTGADYLIQGLKDKGLAWEWDGLTWVCCDLEGLPTIKFPIYDPQEQNKVEITLEPKHYTYIHPGEGMPGCYRVLALKESECSEYETCCIVLGGVFFSKYYMALQPDAKIVAIAEAKH